MATKLTKFPESGGNKRGPKKKPKRTIKSYPWDLWFNGKIWRLKKKQDYFIKTSHMQATINLASRRLGVKVKTRKESDTVIVLQKTGDR